MLYINQFPDVKADAQRRQAHAGRAPWRARGPLGLRAIALLCYGWVLAMVLRGQLPMLALLSLLPAAASVAALRNLWNHAAQPPALAPAIKLTILAAALHGLLLAGAVTLAAAP